MTNTSANKMTYVKALEWVLENPADDTPDDVTKKLEQLLEAQQSRASAGNKKAAENAAGNNALADWIYNRMASEDSITEFTPTDLLGIVQNESGLPDADKITVQKVTYALRLLVDRGVVDRNKKGKKSLYTIVME